MKITVNNPNNLPTISFKELKRFDRNKLKDDKTRKLGSLKTSILTLGFNFPFFVWLEGKYIVDGSSRMATLDMLSYEGYDIPDLPYLIITASNLKEAKTQAIALSSKYAEITVDSAKEFTLDMQDCDLEFAEIGLDIGEIDLSIKPTKEKKKEKGTTIFRKKCPNCGHEF